MSIKTKRLRGSNTHGRGYGKNKNGSRGGVGRAGTKTHKRFSRILEEKKRIKNKKTVNISQIEAKLEILQTKGYLIIKKNNKEEPVILFTNKFYHRYNKILAKGEASFKYLLDLRRIKISKIAKEKLQ